MTSLIMTSLNRWYHYNITLPAMLPKTAQKCCSLIEVGFGDGDQVRVHSSHDGDEGRLSSEHREHTTELTWTCHIE